MRKLTAWALYLLLATPLSAAAPSRRGPAPLSSAPQRGLTVVQPIALRIDAPSEAAVPPAEARIEAVAAEQALFSQPEMRPEAEGPAAGESKAEPDDQGRQVFDGMARVDHLEDAPPLLPHWARRALTLGRAKPYVAEQRSYGRVFDERTARQLARVSALPENEAGDLLAWLRGVDIPWTGALPFPSDTTFSLELEFLTRDQMSEALIEQVSGPMSESEREIWRRDKRLPRERWLTVNRRVLSDLKTALPKGWRFDGGGRWSQKESNFQELRTANSGGVFHWNTAADWAALISGMEAVQRALPGGFYSVHLHTGKQSAIKRSNYGGGGLDADAVKFARIVANHESLWRGLMGVPFSRGTDIGFEPRHVFGDYDTLDAAGSHAKWVNLSRSHPTMEHKNAGYLMKDKKLDPARLRQDLWASFVLLDYVRRSDEPTLTQGLPVTAGMKPTRRQLLLFVDQVFGDDLVGKALALQRLTALEAAPPGRDDSVLRETVRGLYDTSGLGVLWDLHSAHGGRDEKLTHHLRARGGEKLRQLVAELRALNLSYETAEPHLPPEVRADLRREWERPAAAGLPAALPLAARSLPR